MSPALRSDSAIGLAGHLLIALALSAATPGCRRTPDAPRAPHVEIRGHRWLVDVAMTAEDRYTGLSGRQHLPADVGMLFIYPRPEVLEFCMRGCLVPLDIAFIDSDLRVVRTHTMAVEPDRAGRVSYSSQRPAQYALEMAGGSLGRVGVRVGDRVRFSAEIPSPAKAEEGP